jgi:hypothetical protein
MLNGMKFRYLSGEKILILISLILLISCTKKESTIAWKKNITFAEILDSAGDKYVMIDFIKYG